MMKFDTLSDRALGLAEQVGDNMKFLVPRAETLLATGARLGALKTGARMAGLFLRRHPAVTVATVAGAGLLWYAAKRRGQRAEQGNATGNGERQTLEGRAKRVAARNETGGATARRKSAAAARKRATGTRSTEGPSSTAH